jgi:uncharacterized protein YecE (DUF72 family)
MCNCKGWDIAYYPDEITVQQHFCRLVDDCGHTDNTLEEAADEVASAYFREHAWYETMKDEYQDSYSEEHSAKLLETANAWKNRTHSSYLYYKNPVDFEEDLE